MYTCIYTQKFLKKPQKTKTKLDILDYALDY